MSRGMRRIGAFAIVLPLFLFFSGYLVGKLWVQCKSAVVDREERSLAWISAKAIESDVIFDPTRREFVLHRVWFTSAKFRIFGAETCHRIDYM